MWLIAKLCGVKIKLQIVITKLCSAIAKMYCDKKDVLCDKQDGWCDEKLSDVIAKQQGLKLNLCDVITS